MYYCLNLDHLSLIFSSHRLNFFPHCTSFFLIFGDLELKSHNFLIASNKFVLGKYSYIRLCFISCPYIINLNPKPSVFLLVLLVLNHLLCEIILQILKQILQAIKFILQFLYLVYFLNNGLVKLAVFLHYDIKLLTSFFNPIIVLVNFSEFFLYIFVFGPHFFKLRHQCLALFPFILPFSKQLILFFSQP